MTEKEKRPHKERRKAGRPPKTDKTNHCVMVRFNSQEYAAFLEDFERSGANCRAHYIKHRLQNESFNVVKADENTIESYHTLQGIKSEIRKIGVNYNQFIAILRNNFTEQRAAITAEKSAKLLSEILVQNEKALNITLQLVRRWLPR